MSDVVIDLKKQLKDLKAHERLSAFAGFALDLGPSLPRREGVLKIADFTRPDGSGYMTLTFQTDLDPDPASRAALAEIFRQFSFYAAKADPALAAGRFGQGYQYMLVVSDGLMDGDAWFVYEVNLYYAKLAGRVRQLVEGHVLSALAGLMPMSFEPPHWWEAAGA